MRGEFTEEVKKVGERYGLDVTKVNVGKGGFYIDGERVDTNELFIGLFKDYVDEEVLRGKTDEDE